MESLKNWMRDTANILFDDSKNDLRSLPKTCLLYTSDAADDTPCVDLGGRRIIKKLDERYSKHFV